MATTILSSPSNTGPSHKIGLALGCGAARGLAHIGVLRAIEEAGIHVDVVAGSSMGALIAAVFVAGNLDRLAADFLAFDWKSIASLLDPVFPRTGLIDGNASIAVRGLFTPARRDGRILVDGGLVDPVPVSVARDMGANLIITCNQPKTPCWQNSARG